MQPVIVGLLNESQHTPPPSDAVLLVILQFVIVRWPLPFTPPPSFFAVFPSITLSVISIKDALSTQKELIPPPKYASLFLIVHFFILTSLSPSIPIPPPNKILKLSLISQPTISTLLPRHLIPPVLLLFIVQSFIKLFLQ